MKQMKRILAAVLTVTMMMGLVPFTGLAAKQDVGLYWAKLTDDENGVPSYSTKDVEGDMWDEVGQDIHAVFLFWDGTAFSVVAPDKLKFPAKLKWEASSMWNEAVYMKFDTELDDVITYENNGVTYTFELRVVDLSMNGPMSYHDECRRDLDTWLPMGHEGEILYGTPGTPDTAWLMWDTAEVGAVANVTVYFEDVYSDGEVLKNDETLADAAATLAKYNITLTPALADGYIRVDTDFNRARNLVLTLINDQGQRFSRHLNIDEKSTGVGGTLPDAAFFDEMDRSTDAWLSKEIVLGAAGETCEIWFMWDPDRFTVTQKSDIQVYFERNEEEGIELPATPWDAAVDAFLDSNDYTLELDLNNNCVKITATFDRTVDFAMTLTDEDGIEVEAQMNIDEDEEDSVGLYWVKLQGVDEGKPQYSLDKAAPSMSDFVGEDITAVFLFWDGKGYSEVPYDELDIPDEVTYKQSTEYANAVYMEFEEALEDYITYTVDGKTYRFPLTVEAVPELEKGLYCAEFEGLDDEGNPEYSTKPSKLDAEIEDSLGQDATVVFLFWDGEILKEIPLDRLVFPNNLTYESDSEYPNAAHIRYDKLMDGEVITLTTGGVTYAFEVTVTLPLLGFYTDPAGGESAYAGDELSFDGKDAQGNDTDTETWYLRFRDGRAITSVALPGNFVTAEVSSDGSCATVTVSEGFVGGESYRFKAYYEPDEDDEKGFRACSVIINDDRPVELEDGLYWCHVNSNEGDLYPETRELRGKMSMGGYLGDSVWAAFYLVNDGRMTQLMKADLTWDDLVAFELLEEDEEAQDGYFRVRYKAYDSGYISCTKDDVTYRLPVSIHLPAAAYYTEPQRTVAKVTGQELVFDGKDEDGNAVTEETFYLMVEEGWKITKIETCTENMGFYSWEIPDGENYAVVTIGGGFEAERCYEVLVYVESLSAPGETDEWWADFEISDQRPGLKWCSVDDPDGVLTPETDRMRSSMNFGAVLGNSTWAAFYFVDGDSKVQLTMDELNWDSLVSFELLEENKVEKDGFFRVRFNAYGSGYISYTKDDVTYKLPVTIELAPAAFYSAPERTEDNCVGTQLIFDGKDEHGNAVAEETFYLMVKDGWKVTKIKFEDGQPDFFSYEIVDSYAVVTISKGFDDDWYNATVYTESVKDSDNTDWWGVGFEIRDQSPGLRWCWSGRVEDVDNGQYDRLKSTMDMDITGSNSSNGLGFYFVEGDTVTKLDKNADLDFGDTIVAEWNGERGYFDVWFPAFGEYEIVYTNENGNEYILPVTVGLPDFGFYSESTASQETYLGDEFILRGDPTTVYLVCNTDWMTITDLKLDAWNNNDDMSFLDWKISKSGRYITLEIGKEVHSDYAYGLAVYYEAGDGETNDYRMSFSVLKKGPGLLWFPVETDDQGGYTVLDENVHRSTMTLDPGDSFLAQVRYFDGADYTVLPLDKLTVPSFVKLETVDEQAGILRLTCEALGEGRITCADYPGMDITVKVQSADALEFYTQPQRSSAYIDREFNGMNGDVITRYLMWDQSLLPDVDQVTVSLRDGENSGYALEDADVTTTDLSKWGIELTPNLEDGYVQVAATISTWRNVTFRVWADEMAKASVSVNIDEDYDDWGGSPSLTFDYGVIPIKIALADVRGGERLQLMEGGFHETMSNEGDMEMEIVIGAMAWEGTDAECEAPEAVYDAITDVRFYIRKYVNEDVSDDQSDCNVTFSEPYTVQLNGKTLHAIRIMAEEGDFARVEVGADVTVTVNGQPVTHTFYQRYGFKPSAQYEVDLGDLTTAEQVNAVLGSRDSLMNWLKDNEPETYDGIMHVLNKGGYLDLDICLAPVTFDGIVQYGTIIAEDFHGSVNLRGTKDGAGNRTTLPGLRTNDNDSFFLRSIDFVANADAEQTYQGQSFTCGVLLCGERDNGDIYSMSNCTFTGFDYGVYNTPSGYTVSRDCVFTDCGIGYLLDSEGKDGGNGNKTIEGCRFVNCGIGIWIKNLPDYITPYAFRVYENDFIDNVVDIDASQPGRLYFYKNYFGRLSSKTLEDWEDVTVRSARVRGRGYATVIVNPRWRYAVTLDAPNNYLYLDTWNGLFNYMTADEASELTVSAADLNDDLNTAAAPVEINITDQKENDLGTWTFPNGETAAVATYSLRRTVSADFCAALAFGTDDAGNMTVTVQDSSILALRVPTLSVPVDFATAKVLYDGVELEGVTVSGGKVIFPVAAGGAYTIIGTDAETDYVQSEAVEGSADVGAWYDYSDAEEAESFVQIGTETVKEVVQADPDKDLGEALDQVVETEVITVEAVYKAPEDTSVVVLLVLYDADGKMIAMHQQAATEGVNSITVTCDKELVATEAVTVKAFIVAADGSMSPLATVPFSAQLTIPKN